MNRLNSCIKNQLSSCSLRIAFHSKTRLSSLFKFKESILKCLCPHLIYKFSRNCCNATYCGETERHLFVRASEHLGITPLTQRRVKNPQKSAIMDHILSEGHIMLHTMTFRFSFPKIISLNYSLRSHY